MKYSQSKEHVRGITVRLPRAEFAEKDAPFTSEQLDLLQKLVPDWSVSKLVGEALKHYSGVLADKVAADKELELEELRKIADKFKA